ncbi:F-box domain protein [Kalmanozyma brasiliensis GHG001]|uniref:F-box domain protein n=1 Tax=Kalmanozyma brasiliensis (strain GHG001) TaxID=1365824 RepID=UPI002867F9BC|nr:F-box domain protein [Kalmanozyma brasiliensis GHG001]KAF6766843.1 F-box domain protein [Kalmanozyma brasiliensis GHG001]
MLDRLPLELQAYILVFLPAQSLVRTLTLTNHHFHDLVEAHIQRYCLRYLGLGCHSADPDSAAVLEFEAQRPIDTVTAKHVLHFSHFAAVHPSSYNANLPPLSSAAVFSFATGSSSRVAVNSERLRGRGRSEVSVGVETEGRLGVTPFQPYLPGVHEDDRARAANQMIVSSSLDLDERVSRTSSAAQSRSSSTASTSRARAIAQEIAQAPFPFLRQSIEAANRHAMHRPSSSTAGSTPSATQGLNEPLDAYDWAGPPGTRATSTGLSSRKAQRDKPACYAFQLDPLDSFESLILTLTARRSVPDAAAAIHAILRGEPSSSHRLRYSKTLAEGLDRVFRDWFRPSPSPSLPAERTLEFDTTSCTLAIQPHASPLAASAHPAHSSSSHDYLSRPPLSTQYANLASNERVELTFHCETVRINAARLLATLERLEHDVLANQARSRLALKGLPRIVAGSGARVPSTAWTANASTGYFMISPLPTAVQEG